MNSIPTTDEQVKLKFLQIGSTIHDEQVKEIYLNSMKGVYDIKRELGMSVVEAYEYTLKLSLKRKIDAL